ncbi:hypothetical protein CPU67_002874 [Escherichia coli]|nr:hypothetical protein [Escherichia coli]
MFTEFPAPAGINRRTLPNDSGGGRVPRASGDKPTGTNHSSVIVMSSPRQRG